MSYEINVLVNGNKCRQYSHNGKLFIEAKKGSNYSIELKNNTWNRILAICSVDGLDVLSGTTASENGNGYVINGYGSLKIDGFRVSDEKVAKFLFDYKGNSYAASKENNSERNVGVIGVRLFSEKVRPPTRIIIQEEHHHHHDYDYYKYPPYHPQWNGPYYGDNGPYYGDTTIWSAGLTGSPTYGSSCDMSETFSNMECEHEGPELYSCGNIPTKGSPTTPRKNSFTLSSKIKASNATKENVLRSMKCCSSPEPEPLGFDMGTKWGEAKESKVVEVEFEKDILVLTSNIYYASRQSLIEMGIPLGNEKQVSFPEPFSDGKYAKPPQGWQG